MKLPIILASQSPRRKQLLEWANLHFSVVVQPTDETYPNNIGITNIPVYIATQKAIAVHATLKNQAVIIAADTIVVINNTILGKPATAAAALQMLQQLNGKQHKVITGVVIMHPNKTVSFSSSTNVYFNQLSNTDLEFYVNTYKPFDKAGAYGIQEWMGVVGIEKIEGDFYNVMGLPINKVVKELQQLNVL